MASATAARQILTSSDRHGLRTIFNFSASVAFLVGNFSDFTSATAADGPLSLSIGHSLLKEILTSGVGGLLDRKP